MLAKRIANGVGGIVCLALGAMACLAAIALLVGVKDRSAMLWLVCAIIFALGTSLVLFGIKFGSRAISGDMPPRFMSRWVQGGWGRRVARRGYMMLAFPVWFPLVEEGRLRLPSTDDIPAYLLALALGALMVWGGRKAAAAAARES